MIFTPSNFLSLIRGFLVIFFLTENVYYRSLAIVLAMVTDILDGFIARRWNYTSRLGTILDPIMDKFFVLFAIGIFIYEQRMQPWEALCMISRDIAILLFGLYLIIIGAWSKFKFQAIWTGKISTTIQFFILLALTYKRIVPEYVYIICVALGILALFELIFISSRLQSKHPQYKG